MWYDPSGVEPCESWRPDASENLVILRFLGFEPELLAVQVGSILDIDDVLELFA